LEVRGLNLALGEGVVCLFILLQVLHHGADVSSSKRQVRFHQNEEGLATT
jgi:hypothetical protein